MKCSECDRELKLGQKFYYVTEGYVLEDGTGTPETGTVQHEPDNKILCPDCMKD